MALTCAPEPYKKRVAMVQVAHCSSKKPTAVNLFEWFSNSLANGGRFLRQMTNETGSVEEIRDSGYLQQARIYKKQSSLTLLV